MELGAHAGCCFAKCTVKLKVDCDESGSCIVPRLVTNYELSVRIWHITCVRMTLKVVEASRCYLRVDDGDDLRLDSTEIVGSGGYLHASRSSPRAARTT